MVATVPTAIHVEVLPARLGDCLLVECPRPDGTTWRMLVDGGPPDTWPLLEARLRRLDPDDRHIDVAVITHIDSDHIGGMLPFLASDLAADVRDFWFNGRTHLPVTGPAGHGASTRARASSPRSAAPTRIRWPAALGAAVTSPSPAVERRVRWRARRHGRGGRLRRGCGAGWTDRHGALPDDEAPHAAGRLVVEEPARRAGRPRPRGGARRARASRRPAAPGRRADASGHVGAQREQHRPARRAPRGERRARGGRLRERPHRGLAGCGPRARGRDPHRRRAASCLTTGATPTSSRRCSRWRRPVTTSSRPTVTSSTTRTTPPWPGSCSAPRPGRPCGSTTAPHGPSGGPTRGSSSARAPRRLPRAGHAGAGAVIDLPARR